MSKKTPNIAAFIDAIQEGDANLAIAFLEHSPELTTASAGKKFSKGTRAIDVAARVPESSEVLRWMLEHGVDPNARSEPSNETLLHAAANSDNVPGIDVLVAHGADLEAIDDQGLTPIDATVHRMARAAFDRLLHLGANPGLFAPVRFGRLEMAQALVGQNAAKHRRPVIPYLFEEVMPKDVAGAIFLVEQYPELTTKAVCSAGGTFLRYLLDHGADPNAADDEQRTPLHHAAWLNDTEKIQLLLERGAEIESVDIYGYTPIDRTYRGNREAFEFLLALGAKPGLFIALAHERIDLLKDLLRAGPPHRIPDDELMSCLLGEIRFDEEVATLLRDAGFDG